MATIRLERSLAAPIDHVFELLSDHADYKSFDRISASELVREGDTERNGLGALRRIAAGPIHFDEEITEFERPNRMGYLIKSVNLPLHHDGGLITMESTATGTDVLWVSTFDATVPLVSRPLAAAMAAILKRSFSSMLSQIEERAPAPAPAAA